MTDPVIGVLLAGGQSRRMGGGDKCLLPLAGRPLLAHVVERMRPQVSDIVLNANGDPSRFAAFGFPVVADSVEGYAGPLAGVLAGMRWANERSPGARWIVTAATDTPFFPSNLVTKLLAATKGRYPAIALAEFDGRTHPVFGLWPTALADDLQSALEGGTRKVLDWTARHTTVTAPFEAREVGGRAIDPFTNVNRPDELAEAEALLADSDTPLPNPPPQGGRERAEQDLRPKKTARPESVLSGEATPSPPPLRGRDQGGGSKLTRPPIFGVVGWKKSGKTTLVAGLIAELTARGYDVAAMKHAHHAFDIDHEGRNSYQFRKAGARQVALSSSRRWAVMAELRVGEAEPDFAALLAHLGPCDLVLIEGWKGAPFPKIEARSTRTLTREPLARDDPNIVAVATDHVTDAGGLPSFQIDNVEGVADFIETHLRLKRPAPP